MSSTGQLHWVRVVSPSQQIRSLGREWERKASRGFWICLTDRSRNSKSEPDTCPQSLEGVATPVEEGGGGGKPR